MKFFPLIWKNIWRRKLRTIFTLLSVLVAFWLFGILMAVRVAFRAGVDVSGADRMMVTHKTSIILTLPVSYKNRIQAVEGVEQVSFANWFGGIYQDAKNFFPSMAVDPETFLDLYPEYVLPEEQKKVWLEEQTGAIIGRQLADRFGWKVGDRIPLLGPIYGRKDGTRLWEFTVSGIYEGAKKGTDTSSLYFHYPYLREAAAGNIGFVGWYIIRIADPERAPEITRRIDSMFANSPAETKTQTEKQMAQGFANQMGNIGALVTGIVSVVLLILLLLVGNTMALSIRERTNELAVLKTLGFQHGTVLWLVLIESCLVALAGAVAGLAIAQYLVIPAMAKLLSQFLPVFFLPPRDAAIGIGLALLVGLLAGLPPAIQAMRLRIVEALRRV